MAFTWADFFTGFFLANAIPHLVAALMDIKFMSGFGFGKLQNIGYSIFNISLAGGIMLYFGGLETLYE